MKYCTTTTEYNCGTDLHARQMYACVKGNAILANQIARAVYFMLQSGQALGAERMVAHRP